MAAAACMHAATYLAHDLNLCAQTRAFDFELSLAMRLAGCHHNKRTKMSGDIDTGNTALTGSGCYEQVQRFDNFRFENERRYA